MVRDQHRERVRFLARRATGTPDPDLPIVALAYLADESSTEQVPGLRIAVKPGDIDRDRVLESIVLCRHSIQQGLVLGVGVNPAGSHPDRDAPAQTLVLVCVQRQPGLTG